MLFLNYKNMSIFLFSFLQKLYILFSLVSSITLKPQLKQNAFVIWIHRTKNMQNCATSNLQKLMRNNESFKIYSK